MGLSNPLHIAVLAVIILLLFGARRLPELGRSLGTGIKEFKGTLDPATHEPQTPSQDLPVHSVEPR